MKKKRSMTIFAMVALVVLVLVASVSAMAEPLVPGAYDPEVYYHMGNVVVDSDRPSVFYDGTEMTATTTVSGRIFWLESGAPEGAHVITTTVNSLQFNAVDLINSGVYYDSLGVYVEAHPEDWGRTGVVIMGEVSSLPCYDLYSVAGLGYSSSFPQGTLFWDYNLGQWAYSQLLQELSMVAVPNGSAACDPTATPEPPTATPTDPPPSPTETGTPEPPTPTATTPAGLVVEGPFDPEVYLWEQDRYFASVGSVTVDSNPVTTVVSLTGREFYHLPSLSEGIHVIEGQSSYTATVVDLFMGESYSAYGANIAANNEDWGRTGIVDFGEIGQNCSVISIAGWGYTSSFPSGTLFWDYTNQVWSTSQILGQLAYVCIPVPSTPTATPTDPPPTVTPSGTPPSPTPTATPTDPPPSSGFTIFLPVVQKAMVCKPYMPFYWQVATGLGACSNSNPGQQSGIDPVQVTGEPMYNWFYNGLLDGWITPGGTFDGTYLNITPQSTAVGVHEHGPYGEFDAVYSVYGTDFSTIQDDWGDVIKFYDFATGTWSTTAVWGTYNVMGVIDN